MLFINSKLRSEILTLTFLTCGYLYLSQAHDRVTSTIVIIRNWLGNPANFKGAKKDQKIYVGRSTTLHNLLFCAHTLWLNYVTVTFLLVSSSGTNYDLLCFCRVMAKKANKNIEHRTFTSINYASTEHLVSFSI